jgi:L-cysteine S-thiosulfotransferase
MVCQHHSRHVWLIVAFLCGMARADEDSARAIITDARRGNCLTCHRIPPTGIPDSAFGNIGPSLTGVGARLSVAQIKERIVDPRRTLPDTLMPPYGNTEGLYRVQKVYENRPILTEAEIDLVVTYLSSLK